MAKGGRVAAAVASGLLTGAGKAFQITAEQRFQEKMENLRNTRRDQERAEDRDFQREVEGERQFQQLARDTQQQKSQERRDDARDASENARLDKTIAAQSQRSSAEQAAAGARTQATQGQMVRRKDGSLVWAFPDGTVKPVMDGDKPLDGEPVKPGAQTSDDDAGLFTIAEKRTIDTFEAQNKDMSGRVDRTKVIAQLAKTNKKLAEKYAGEPVNADGLTQAEARRKAQTEAGDKKSVFKSRKSEFADDGGDEEKFIARRTAELMGTQQPQQQAAPGSAMAAEPQAQPKPQSLAGAGTREQPFTATTQADIDWFKTYAPKDSILIVNGQSFVK